MQENNRRIFQSDAIVVENDRIRRELRPPTSFIRIPLTRAVIENEQRAAVFDKLQQPRIELDQFLMRFVAAIVDDDRVIGREVRFRNVIDSQLRCIDTEGRERTFQRLVITRQVTNFPAAHHECFGIDERHRPLRDWFLGIRQINCDRDIQSLVLTTQYQGTTHYEIRRF